MTTQQVTGIDRIRGAWNGIAGVFDEFVTPENLVLGTEVAGPWTGTPSIWTTTPSTWPSR